MAKKATEGPESNLKSQNAEPHSDLNMANLETILQELQDFRQENLEILQEIKEDFKVANNRIDNTEKWIEEAEEHLKHIEDATIELQELQKWFETRLVDQEGQSRRGNIRIHGLMERVEDCTGLMTDFIEKLLEKSWSCHHPFPSR